MELDLRKHSRSTGIIKRHPDGFGFFVSDNPEVPDIYIPKQFMSGVMTNDKVEIGIYPEPGGKRFRGEVIRIIERSFIDVIGKYHTLNPMFGVIYDDNNNWGSHLNIPKGYENGAKDGDLVVARIISYADKKGDSLVGKITEVIGDSLDPLFDTKKVIINHKIPNTFSSAVMDEAKKFEHEVRPELFKKRRDLSTTKLITIDGVTAKDFDDAIFVESNEQGFKLIVAIADVSHYVKIGSSIDKEAYQRGTSTYFPNFVVPMLPEVLSNELCSLKPDVYRLCFAAEMLIDFQGHVLGCEFFEAIMKSHARVTYGEAQEVIDGNTPEKLENVKEVILRAADLAKILMAKRFKEGSLDLEIPETEVIVDELGQPVDVQRSERVFAHRLIEELMLVTNVEVAKFSNKNNAPTLFRIHEPPKFQNVEMLNGFLKTFGSTRKLSGGKIQKDLTRALQEFQGTPQEIILNILTLRSMNQAKYSNENVGHFGLGFHEYCHFTSPIRRYPDLIVHRVLKNILRVPGYDQPSIDTLSSAGTFLSACEQRSTKAERQHDNIKKARFMQRHLGENFEGIISSVTKFGVFVLLRQFDCDGLVKIDDLGNDHFQFLEDQMMLVGKRSGLQYRIGDIIEIQVASCDVELGQVSFVLKNHKELFQGRERRNAEDRFDRKIGDKKRGFFAAKQTNRQNNQKRKKTKDNSHRSGKARLSKRSRKGKAR